MDGEGPGVYVDPRAPHYLERAGMPRRALLLDRDGVINIDRGYVHTPDQTAFVPGIFDLCRAAGEAGYLSIVVTNQAGIARGLYTESQFLRYTAWLHHEFESRGAPLLATYFCPHHPTAGSGAYLRDCGCRKPAPGMILAAAQCYGLDLTGSFMVGDKAGDIEAGRAAGVGTLVLLGDDPDRGVAAVETLFDAKRIFQARLDRSDARWTDPDGGNQ